MNTPKIRFKEFKDDWEQRKLGEVVGIYDGVHQTPQYQDSGIMFLSVENITTLKSEKYISEEAFERDYKVYPQKGDILMTRIGDVGTTNVVQTTEKVAFYVSLALLKPKEINSYFLSNAMKTSVFQKGLRERTLVTAIPQKINKDEIGRVNVFITNNAEEQKKIGDYFTALDHLITLHQRKCDETKQLKKFMLQKMFPKNGEKNPEIRFEGFTDDWEQRKFGEITELKSASRVHKDEWTSNGVPFYRSSDVMAAINETENEKAFISEELYEKLSKVSGKLEEGDILVTGGGSVGNPYIVPDNKPLYTKDADLLWIKNKGKFHPYFLYEFFFSPTFRNYLGSISHVGTIAHYTITQLSDTPICLPSFEEQKKVGEYFQSLDNLITLHQRKCEKLKELKKFMLQNMFV